MNENTIEKYKQEILRLRELCWNLEDKQFKVIDELGGSNSAGYLMGRNLVKDDYLSGKDIFDES